MSDFESININKLFTLKLYQAIEVFKFPKCCTAIFCQTQATVKDDWGVTSPTTEFL